MTEQDFTLIASDVANYLKTNGWKLAIAESCTGGWVCQVVTSLAESSEWFDRGFVVYSNQAKQDMLKVKASTLETYGAVSEETARAMAKGALEESEAQASLAITGIAGPGGGTDEKPVGTVWFAWGIQDTIKTVCRIFEGDRKTVRAQCVQFALTEMREMLARFF